MQLSKQGYLECAQNEGLSLKPYLCSAGVKTIGFGSTVSDIPDLPQWSWEKEITIEEAVRLYKQGMQKYVNGVNRVLTRLEIPQHQFDALVSVTYNIGVGRAATKNQKGSGMTNSTFMRLINAKASNEEIARAIRLWNKPPEVRSRRAREAKLFVDGIYTNDGHCDLITVDAKHRPRYSSRIKIFDYF